MPLLRQIRSIVWPGVRLYFGRTTRRGKASVSACGHSVEDVESRIESVTGSGPGTSLWGRIESVAEDGSRMGISFAPRPGAAKMTLELVGVPQPRRFDVCPICVTGEPTDREHVPNGAIGGRVITYTCGPCNNGLGGSVEAALTTWATDSWMRGSRFSADGVRGQRPLPRIDLRWTDTAQFALLVAGGIQSDVDGVLRRGGEFTVEFRAPDMARVRLAALKHAYLTACLAMGTIPQSATAERIRVDLLAARDIRAREPMPHSSVAAGLELGRTYAPPSGPAVAIMAPGPLPKEGPMDAWICLAGVVMVRWPLPEWTLAAVRVAA